MCGNNCDLLPVGVTWSIVDCDGAELVIDVHWCAAGLASSAFIRHQLDLTTRVIRRPISYSKTSLHLLWTIVQETYMLHVG